MRPIQVSLRSKERSTLPLLLHAGLKLGLPLLSADLLLPNHDVPSVGHAEVPTTHNIKESGPTFKLSLGQRIVRDHGAS